MMYGKDAKADMLVKIYLSFFSVSKIIPLTAKVSKSTFSSIVSPWEDETRVLEQIGQIKWNMRDLLLRYLPRLTTIPLHQGFVWEPTWKALPMYRVTEQVWRTRLKRVFRRRAPRSCFTTIPYEIPAFQFLMNFVHAMHMGNRS